MRIDQLLELMRALRDPERGCPWDRGQTFDTIAPYTIEEAYEVADAIARGDLSDLCEELGDLLFQVVFHAQMASEQDAFEFADVVRAIVTKMTRRHPHVFGPPGETRPPPRWEALKAAERAAKRRAASGPDGPGSALDAVPVTLPALARARVLQRRAAGAGFDWRDHHGVLAKLREELGELETELASDPGSARARAELGDLLFTCVNLARHQGADAERALGEANLRFERRFRAMEARARAGGEELARAGPERLEALWQAAKAELARDPG